MGVLSLVFWSLVLVVTVKYVAIIMRADNRGEGGILVLTAVVQKSLPIAAPLAYGVGCWRVRHGAVLRRRRADRRRSPCCRRVEGLGVVAPGSRASCVPATCGAACALFSIQKRGVAASAPVRPITLVWFLAIARARRRRHRAQSRGARRAESRLGVRFFVAHGVLAWLSLGAVCCA
jgi:KUP system potassium uptake protein